MRRFVAGLVAFASVGCAFEVGPAREVPVELESGVPVVSVNDLGWEVTLAEVRLFLHRVRFFPGEAEAAAATGTTHAHLMLAKSGGFGVIRLAHSHGGDEEPAADLPVGELLVDRALDLLAGPHDLGTAVFALGAVAGSAAVRVAPPDGGEGSGMHGGGLYLAGSARPPAGGDPVAFGIVLTIGVDVAVDGLHLHADELDGLSIRVHGEGWFDGIDFGGLPDGMLEDGEPGAERLEQALSGGVHVVPAGA